MNKLFENIIIFVWYALKEVNNINQSKDFKDIYYLIDYLTYSIGQIYPQIPCKEKCTECCKINGLPSITLLEWKEIYNYILQLNSEDREFIIKNNKKLYGDKIEELIKLNDKRIKNISISICPLLKDDLCLVYPVRPAICRGFGYFSVRKEDKSSFLACNYAADILVNVLSKNGINEFPLPVWNKFIEKVYELNGEVKILKPIPLWLNENIDDLLHN